MNIAKLIAIRIFIAFGIMILGFLFLAEVGNKVYVSRVDCEGPVITQINACRSDKSCLVSGNDGKKYRVVAPSLNANICLNQVTQ